MGPPASGQEEVHPSRGYEGDLADVPEQVRQEMKLQITGTIGERLAHAGRERGVA